jgi:hypothetical protein
MPSSGLGVADDDDEVVYRLTVTLPDNICFTKMFYSLFQ